MEESLGSDFDGLVKVLGEEREREGEGGLNRKV